MGHLASTFCLIGLRQQSYYKFSQIHDYEIRIIEGLYAKGAYVLLFCISFWQNHANF